MTIADMLPSGKGVSKRFGDVLIVALLVLSATGGFGLGVLAGRDGKEESAVVIEKPVEAAAAIVSKEEVAEVSKPEVKKETKPNAVPASGGQFVASKTGTKYYLPWCGTVKRIKEENKVWFATKAEAEAAGYEPGKNCKGI